MRFRSQGRGGRHLTLTPNITSPPHPPGLHSTRKAGVAGGTFSALLSLLLLLLLLLLIFSFFNLNFCEISGGSCSSLLVMFVISLGLGLAF